MLQTKPSDRPSLTEILEDDFFTKGFFPSKLPCSSVTASPKWSEYEKEVGTDKKISKEAIKKITIALSRQMRLDEDKKDVSEERDSCVVEDERQEKCYLESVGEPDSGVSDVNGSPCALQDIGEEGMSTSTAISKGGSF